MDQERSGAASHVAAPARITADYPGEGTLGQLLKVDASLYGDVKIEVLNLGTRPFNRLMHEKVRTVGLLLSKTVNELASIHNMGRRSLDELLEKLQDYLSDPETREAREWQEGDAAGDGGSYFEKPAPIAADPAYEDAIAGFLSGREDFAIGLDETGLACIERIRESAEIVGKGILLDACRNREYCAAICKMLKQFSAPRVQYMNARWEAAEKANRLQEDVRGLRAIPFLNAYNEKYAGKVSPIIRECGQDTKIRQIPRLLDGFRDDANMPDIMADANRFLEWMDFDIQTITQNILEKTRTMLEGKVRAREVIRLRSKGESLKHIADQYGLSRERIRQIEKKAYGKFWSACEKQKYDTVLLAYALRNGDKVLTLDKLSETLGDEFAKMLWNSMKYNEKNTHYHFAKEMNAIVVHMHGYAEETTTKEVEETKEIKESKEKKGVLIEDSVMFKEKDTDFIVDFNNNVNMVFTKPVSLAYDGKTIQVETWRGLYCELCKRMLEGYPSEFERMKQNSLNRYTRRWLVDEEHKDLLNKSLKIAPGYFIEARLNANSILKQIRWLLNQCKVDYKNVIIVYKYKKDEDVDIGQTNHEAQVEYNDNVEDADYVESDESDMKVRAPREDAGDVEKVYDRYPLIGSKILKPEEMEQIDRDAKSYIDKMLKQHMEKQQTEKSIRAEMTVALAVVNYAKNWSSDENPDFWKYITLQFGYRDEKGLVRRILQQSIEDAMKWKKRLFIEREKTRGFKATTMVHAFSPRKSWMSLFDFLFDFYKENLDWKYIPKDPYIGRMVRALQKKLKKEANEDAELTISFRTYLFQEGIKKLILYRPAYARSIFERLIARIDGMVRSEYQEAKTYEEQLCEDWFKEKIAEIASTRKTSRRNVAEHREVAIDYSRVRVRYVLEGEKDVRLVLPDIRLRAEDVQRVSLFVYRGKSMVFSKDLAWYGNELGMTARGESVSLSSCDGGDGSMNIRVKIVCNDEVIHDSEDSLSRRDLVFYGEKEVDAAKMRAGSYTVVAPTACRLEAENAEVARIEQFNLSGLSAYFLELHDGYMVALDGRVLALDSGSGADIRIMPPSDPAPQLRFCADGEEWRLALRGSACTIALGSAEGRKRFVIMRNGERVDFSQLQNAGGDLAFLLPLAGDDGFCRVRVLDIEGEKTIFDSGYLLASEAECGFDREFYYSDADYENAALSVRIDDFDEEEYFARDDEEVRIPFQKGDRKGELRADIPKVEITETTGKWLDGTPSSWYVGNIPQDSLLEVKKPEGVTARFLLEVKKPEGVTVRLLAGKREVPLSDKGAAPIGNEVKALADSGAGEPMRIEMAIGGSGREQTYTLAEVYYKECFLKKPEFWYRDGRMFWDQGGVFIGKKGRDFTLTLAGDGGDVHEMKLDAHAESVCIPEDVETGNYRYEISISSGGLFKSEKVVLAEGECVIGDQDLVRFKDRFIEIDSITDGIRVEKGHIPIRPCYIDQIEFVGIEDTPDGRCPVYSGVLYDINRIGVRHDFSFARRMTSKGTVRTKVNPVRIVYIGETVLSITDSEGDGLYYHRCRDKERQESFYALTDHECTKENQRSFSTADLYSYRTERR